MYRLPQHICRFDIHSTTTRSLCVCVDSNHGTHFGLSRLDNNNVLARPLMGHHGLHVQSPAVFDSCHASWKLVSGNLNMTSAVIQWDIWHCTISARFQHPACALSPFSPTRPITRLPESVRLHASAPHQLQLPYPVYTYKTSLMQTKTQILLSNSCMLDRTTLRIAAHTRHISSQH